MKNNWTPARPTKPGRYEVCFGPPRGFDGYRVWVVEVWREQPSGKLFAQRGILDIPINPDPSDIDTLTEALWRPYVEPPDPFAEPVPKPSEFKAYRLSDDAKTPNLRLILDVEPGMVTLYEADMTSRSPEAQETEMHDKIMMSQADARWLRDTLNNADLSDPPGWDR